MNGGYMVRVRYRSGVLEHFGPMAHHNAAAKVDAIRRLAEDPRSEFASASMVRRKGGAHDLSHRIAMDGFRLFGHGWHRRLERAATTNGKAPAP